jgi:ribosomal protein S12 methylthiotransferase
MKQNTFHLVSLGCAKNTVDSESMAQLLVGSGYHPVDRPEWASVLIVNTCGFIGPAKEESLSVLGDLAAHKRKDQVLIAAGCLTQRYGVEVARQIPGIDGILGTRRWMDIVKVVRSLRGGKKHPEPVYHLPEAPTGKDERGVTASPSGRQRLKMPMAAAGLRLLLRCSHQGTMMGRPVERSGEGRLQDAGVRRSSSCPDTTTTARRG